MSKVEPEEQKDINNTQIDSTGSKTDQTNNDQVQELTFEESNKQTQQSNSIFKGLGNMGSFGISDGIASGANYFTNKVNSVHFNDDDIERDFKTKILDAIQFFNIEYTKTIKGDSGNDKRNDTMKGNEPDAIGRRGEKILSILKDTLGLFSNMDDDVFFNELKQFIQKKENANIIKTILINSNDSNTKIKDLLSGLKIEDGEEGMKIKLGAHGVLKTKPDSTNNVSPDSQSNLGGKRIKKRTKKNKKSSKKTKTKRNRK